VGVLPDEKKATLEALLRCESGGSSFLMVDWSFSEDFFFAYFSKSLPSELDGWTHRLFWRFFSGFSFHGFSADAVRQ